MKSALHHSSNRVLSILGLMFCLPAYAGWWLSFPPSLGSDVNGCTGYSVWAQPTNAPDKNVWQWQAQTTKWDGTNILLPTSLTFPCYLSVTSDRVNADGTATNSYRSEKVLVDTNQLNKLRPLLPPAGLQVIWKD